jgi:hypothetical protein
LTVAAAVAVNPAPGLLDISSAAVDGIALVGPIVLLLGLVLASKPRFGDVGTARLRQIYDLVELIAILSLVPLAIAVVGGFAWAAG